MPIYQKGTSTVTKVKDMYLCDAASSFTRICKVYLCTGANTFVLVYDGCGFACDGYFIEGSCSSSPVVNYYGNANETSSYALTAVATYKNSTNKSYWNLTTYQCSTCPPPGNVIVEYQTCPNSSGEISPYLFINRGIDKFATFNQVCFSDSLRDNMPIASVNNFIPLVNANIPSGYGKDPGVCMCVDQEDWKVPTSIKYITTKTGNAVIDIDVNNGSFTTPSGLACDSTDGFRENLNFGSASINDTYSKYGIFWGADGINPETDGACPIYCYGSSGGNSSSDNPTGYACKSVAKIPLIFGSRASDSGSVTEYFSTDIKDNNNNTAAGIFEFYRLFNLGFAVKIKSGTPSWKMKITYPVYFSQKELEDLYGLTTSNYTLGSEYEWTGLFNSIPDNTSKTYFDLLMMKPLSSLYLRYSYIAAQRTEQIDFYNNFWHRTTNITTGNTVTYNQTDQNNSISNKPVFCLSIEISGNGNGICSSALYAGTDSNRKIKLQPMTDSSNNLFDQYKMFTLSNQNTAGQQVNASFIDTQTYDTSNNCSEIGLFGSDFSSFGSEHYFLNSGNPSYSNVFEYVDNYWTYTKQVTDITSPITIEGTSTKCSGEQD